MVIRNIWAPDKERLESASEAIRNEKLGKILRDPIAIAIAVTLATLILANWPKY